MPNRGPVLGRSGFTLSLCEFEACFEAVCGAAGEGGRDASGATLEGFRLVLVSGGAILCRRLAEGASPSFC